ncbi:MAG: RtcB family protein [Lachnospiraceae bacterium]|nr:RtcB family protein [Lachnospiraceae bacterium]
MKTIHGVYTSAKIFNTEKENNTMDDYALAQLKALCDNQAFDGCTVRIMPDVHPGKVGTIGFTSTLGKQVLPNVIGIDIGCGMSLAKVKGKTKEFQKLDVVIREHVPSGFSIRKTIHSMAQELDLTKLLCYKHIFEEKARLSLGTLGGGNHFIELDVDDEKNTYLVVHSGSRHLGKEVTEYYLSMGQRQLKSKGIEIPYETTYLEGELMDAYLHDLEIVQEFAFLNREIILAEITKNMKWKILDSYSCIHNYVDFRLDTPILRKGAISAQKDEPVIIPINMRDGILLGTGLGNADWNYSAPHGAGRIMKREDVKANYTVSNFKSAMKGIYSSCINKETLDEAPFAYRDLDSIQYAIQETVAMEKIIKPIYNFKAGN